MHEDEDGMRRDAEMRMMRMTMLMRSGIRMGKDQDEDEKDDKDRMMRMTMRMGLRMMIGLRFRTSKDGYGDEMDDDHNPRMRTALRTRMTLKLLPH